MKGVALITALLILLILMALALAMVTASSSDMLISGYYRNFRGAFSAADSGLNVARQDMLNRIIASASTNFSSGTSPIPAGTDVSVQQALLAAYKDPKSVDYGLAAGSMPGSYRLSAASLSLLTSCSPQPCTPPPYTSVSTDLNGKVTGYQYVFKYSLTTIGQSVSREQTTITDSGNAVLNATVAPATGAVSFASWGMFIDQYAQCSGGYLVPGTITGPVFTNGSWTFGSTGQYIFTDAVGSVSSTAGYQFSNNCYSSPTSSYTDPSGTKIAPTFQSQFNLAQSPVPLPQNDYSQKRAVLDSKGLGGTAVTTAELNAKLLDSNGIPYPSTGTTSGVYLPYKIDSASGTANFTGGGIYVEGDAKVAMTASAASAQVWTITQGTTITSVTIDNVANTTTFSSNGTTKTIYGVPWQHDPSDKSVRPATMLYVNGNITDLAGTQDAYGNSVPAVQDGQAITITAAGNITITGDVLYKTEPVTTTANQPPLASGTPADTLIPGNDNKQVLGIFTPTGNVQLANTQPLGNLEIDASIATISQGGKGGIVNTGAAISTLTIVGGRIQNGIYNINSAARNVFFDRRFASGGFAPPWFPSTTITPPPGTFTATITSSVQRVQWVNQTTF